MQNVAYAEAYAFRSAVTGPPVAAPPSSGTTESRVIHPVETHPNAVVTFKGGRLVRRSHGVWSTASAAVMEVVSEEGIQIEFSGRRPMIAVVLEEVGGRLEMAPRGQHAGSSTLIDQGVVVFVPGGVASQASSPGMRFLRLFTLEFDSTAVNGLPARRLAALSGSQISKLCRLLAVECKEPESNGRAYADNLVSALAIALSRVDDGPMAATLKGGLAPWQLRRVQEHMIEHLAEIVAVKDLADMAQISLTHFSRAFKASVGIAPHQWMTERRMEIAKRRLLEGEMAIVEISLVLGYCDQAHFTRAFRRAVGVTPLIWQRASRD